MKFVLILAALLAMAYAEQATVPTLDLDKLQQALVEVGVNPEEAHGFMDFISSVGSFIKDKVIPVAQTVLPIATQVVNALG